MHIPDGFIAPQMYLPAYGLAAVAWGVAVRRAGGRMADETLPRLAVLTAATFVLMTVMIPLPGGTSIHLSGAALLALIFGLTNTLLAIFRVPQRFFPTTANSTQNIINIASVPFNNQCTRFQRSKLPLPSGSFTQRIHVQSGSTITTFHNNKLCIFLSSQRTHIKTDKRVINIIP